MNGDLTVTSAEPGETLAIGAAVGELCQAGDVVALSGELGAGKTQFVRGMARGLGVDPRHVSSPTFVIAQEYESADHALVMVHIDAYRLTDGRELASLGWAGDGDLPDGAVLAIEWADRVMDTLGANRLEVAMAHHPAGRRITLRPLGSWVERMIDLQRRVVAATRHD